MGKDEGGGSVHCCGSVLVIADQGENLVQVGVGRVKNPLLCLNFLSAVFSVWALGAADSGLHWSELLSLGIVLFNSVLCRGCGSVAVDVGRSSQAGCCSVPLLIGLHSSTISVHPAMFSCSVRISWKRCTSLSIYVY